jgi:hypothetical protein
VTELFVVVYALFTSILTIAGLMWCAEEKRLPPRWILALWVFFAAPVLIKAWLAVVLS